MARVQHLHAYRIGLFALLVFSAGAIAQETRPASNKWDAYVDLEAKLGSKRSLGEADVFLPIMQDARTLVFGNLRGRFDDDSSREGNLGLGVRRMQESGWNLGAYGYLDRRRSGEGNYFNQLTLGGEALGRDWDFRANGYVPLGDKARDIGNTSVASMSGTSVLVTTSSREERALKGVDGEVGWRAPLFAAEARHQLRLYVGGYHFSDAGITVEGPRVRAELAMEGLAWFGGNIQLFLGAEAQHDGLRGDQTFLSARLRIPLGKEGERRSLSVQERRMVAPVMRDVDIVTQSRVAATLVETATTTGGQSITVINSATTGGGALQGALNTAGANSTVVLSGTFNTNAQINMSAGQTMIGAGTLAVRTASGRTATLTTPGATIAATGNSTVTTLNMANNATLRGMTITNPYNAGAGNGVSAQARTGVTISNNVISAGGSAGGYAVDAAGATNTVISGNTIIATSTGGASAIGIRAPAGNNIAIAGNTFTMTGATQYVIAGDNTSVFATANSTGNVTNSGSCIFLVGAPTGSVGFSSISCP